ASPAGGADEITIADVVKSELQLHFQRERNSADRVLVCFGITDEADDCLVLVPPTDMRGLDFLAYDKAYEAFERSALARVAHLADVHSASDQSTPFGIFGYQYVVKRTANIRRV